MDIKKLVVSNDMVEALIHPAEQGICKVIDNTACCMKMHSEQIDDRLFFMTCETTSRQAVRVSMASDFFANNIGIGFLMDGEKIDYLQGWDSPQKMLKNRLLLCYAPIMSGYVEFLPSSHTYSSSLYLPRTVLLQILETEPRPKVHELFAPIFNAPDQAFYLHASMTPAIISLLKALQQHQQMGFMNAFLRKAQVYQLLQLTIEAIIDEYLDNLHDIKLSVDDVVKLQDSKDIVIQNMQKPLGISELSKLVGLNEFKLKRGFKQLFCKTVFQYLHDVRMQRAAYLCLHSELSMVEIAQEIGYSNHGHFSIAFRKMYGQSPSKYRKEALQFFV